MNKSGYLTECDMMEDGDQILFSSLAEAEDACFECCTITPAPNDYDGPAWYGEDGE